MFQEGIHLLLVWANFVAICQSVRQDIDERIIRSLAADFQFQLNKLITRRIWTGFYLRFLSRRTQCYPVLSLARSRQRCYSNARKSQTGNFECFFLYCSNNQKYNFYFKIKKYISAKVLSGRRVKPILIVDWLVLQSYSNSTIWFIPE
jgi:hypothetical protein